MLSAEEQAELDQLNSQAAPPKSGLTPEEEKELAALNAGAPADPATSPVTAATTGLANGASYGLAGKLAGVGKTAMDAITGTRGPLAGESLSDLGDDYAESRDSFKGDANKAAEAHPYVSGAANVAGALVPVAPSLVGDFISKRMASKAAIPVIEKSESWARSGLSNALDDKSGVAAEIAKRIAKRAVKAAILGH